MKEENKTIHIGPCKCGGYGQVLNEEASKEAGVCHLVVGDECINHRWKSNGGAGRVPEFEKRKGLFTSAPLMSVRCEHCGARQWFDKEAWEALPVRVT